MATDTKHVMQAGASSRNVTPPVGVAMQGYGLRHAAAINDPILGSALAVGDDRVEWLLLTIDAIGLDRGFTARVRQTIGERFLLPPSAITMACSHTHSGPATLPHLGAVPADSSYLAFLEAQLAIVAEEAVKNLQPAHWRIGGTTFSENINRRLRRGRRILLDTDPNGPVDNRLRVMRIDRASGSQPSAPLALLIHYACHATTSSGVPEISSDFPGYMRANIQRLYGEDHEPPVICFLQGCAGDLTHRIGRNRDAWPQHFEQHTCVQSEILGRLAAAAAINASERSVGFPMESVRTIIEPLSLPFYDRSGTEETELQLIRLGPQPTRPEDSGDAAWIVGLPGEPFTVYSTDLGRQFYHHLGVRNDYVLVCGYTNDCVGYLCTPKALREGGYEAAMAHQMYHRPAPFAAATQKIVFDCSLKAAKTIAGDAPLRVPRLFSGRSKVLHRWRSLLS
jgi:neutral ceramidase